LSALISSQPDLLVVHRSSSSSAPEEEL
jgi:hAT family C-terminal dimerisation region